MIVSESELQVQVGEAGEGELAHEGVFLKGIL